MTLTKQSVAPLFATIIAGCFTGLTLGACDLVTKPIGEETQGDGGGNDDGAADDGGTCEEGETQPADDGCNTCTCDENGNWACTEIACGDDGPGDGPGDDAGDGGECTPGDMMDAPDGCNTCTCDDDGTWACTLLGCEDDGPGDDGGECDPGDTMPADDGCNTCECLDDGTWACTEIACQSFPVCADDLDGDPFSVVSAVIVDDELQVTVAYSGGCAKHEFDLCWGGAWAESEPVQTDLIITHTDPGDPCDAFPSEERVYDLTGLRQAYAAAYGPTGTIDINLSGHADPIAYSF